MATAEQARAIFDSLVGITESPAHSNRTPIGVEFGWNGVAWCSESCWVVLNHRLGIPFPHTASVAEAIAAAKRGQFGLTWVPRDGLVRVGDLSTFDWGGRGNPSDFHISFVRDPGTQARFQTDGGNENDAVRQQWRDRAYVQGFIRPAYSGSPAPGPAPTPSPEEDDDMAATDTCELRYGPGEQCTIDLDNLKNGAAGWRNAVVRIPFDYVGDVRSHRVRVVAIDQEGKVGTALKTEFVDIAAGSTVVVSCKPEWAIVSITSQAPKRDPRGDANVRTVFWK